MNKILIHFRNEEGICAGPPIHVPVTTTREQLEFLLNEILQNHEKIPYAFRVFDFYLKDSLEKEIIHNDKFSIENALNITYMPEACFRVRSVTRCSSTLAGHTDAILCVQFSPDGRRLASGSGDTTVRLWDLNTETPIKTCKGHTNWVLCLSWSTDGKILASGGMDRDVFLWDGFSGGMLGKLQGHSKWITSISWEPFHANPLSNRLASASKDGTVRVWNVLTKKCEFSVSQHTDAVTCVKWGGEGLIYSGSRDKTVKVWDSKDGKLCRVLFGHAHWVNTMALSTEYAIRMGPFDNNGKRLSDDSKARQAALERYSLAKGNGPEKLITGSDDFTLFLWEPALSKKPISRMTGHQQLVNQVIFSPDGRLIASASFDKSIKIWDSKTGKFITSLRGHVAAVYQIAFSADSRLLLSGSKDSTLKVWDLNKGKLKADLPGHADEVYAVDWSVTGEHAASGSKDRMMKFWKN